MSYIIYGILRTAALRCAIEIFRGISAFTEQFAKQTNSSTLYGVTGWKACERGSSPCSWMK